MKFNKLFENVFKGASDKDLSERRYDAIKNDYSERDWLLVTKLMKNKVFKDGETYYLSQHSNLEHLIKELIPDYKIKDYYKEIDGIKFFIENSKYDSDIFIYANKIPSKEFIIKQIEKLKNEI